MWEATAVIVMFEQVRADAGKSLKGMDRYNPENLDTLDHYEETQAEENIYDLEANPAVLKLYPAFIQTTVTAQILLQTRTNLPHTDFTLCNAAGRTAQPVDFVPQRPAGDLPLRGLLVSHG